MLWQCCALNAKRAESRHYSAMAEHLLGRQTLGSIPSPLENKKPNKQQQKKEAQRKKKPNLEAADEV